MAKSELIRASGRAPDFESPLCLRCKAVMDLAPMIPGLGSLADRIFRCNTCDDFHVTSQA
jgi:hypothetical protein